MSEATDDSLICVRGRWWPRDAYEQDRRDRRAITQFVEACRRSHAQAMLNAITGVEQAHSGWRSVIRRVRRLPGTTPAFRRIFLEVWIKWGDHIRQEVRDDHTL